MDGDNDLKRSTLLSVTGNDRIGFFDVFHGLLFGAPSDGRHIIAARRPSGEEMRLELAAIGLAERRAQSQRLEDAADKPAWDWAVRQDGVAVLTMPSWALCDSKWDWRRRLGARLDSLAEAKGLLIDLPGNEGGEDCGD